MPPRLPLFADTQPSGSARTPGWESFLTSTPADPRSPVVEYGLSLKDLNQRVVTPFKSMRDITLDGRTVSYSEIERIEIWAVGRDVDFQPSYRTFLDRLGSFEWKGADVSKEFIPPDSSLGPSIGTPERPEAISVDQLFERLVTDETLRQATRTRFRSRNFADAVEAAFKCLDKSVRDKSGLSDKSGSKMMFAAFSEKNPVLKLNGLRDSTDMNEQEGYKHLFAGAMMGVRNPRAHEHEIRDSPKVALELLAFANHLMSKLDGATRE